MGSLLMFIARLTLVVINLIIGIVALSLVVVGSLIKFNSGMFSEYTQPVLDEISKGAGTVLGDTVDTGSFDIGEVFGPLAIILIVVGGLLLSVSGMGCCGACCNVKKMLVMYTLVLAFLVIGQIVLVIIFFGYNGLLKDAVRIPLKEMIKTYQGLNGTNVESITWNFVMLKFACCGVDNYNDFSAASDWFGNNDASMEMPLACCIDLPTSVGDLTCASSLDSTLNFYDTGCLDSMWSVMMEQDSTLIIVGIAAVLLFQIILIVFAILVICKEDTNKPEPAQRAGGRGQGGPQW